VADEASAKGDAPPALADAASLADTAVMPGRPSAAAAAPPEIAVRSPENPDDGAAVPRRLTDQS